MPVVDASLVVDWVAPDVDPAGPARTLLHHLAHDESTILGPRLLVQEVANALITGVRRGRWDGVAADDAFALLSQLPLRLSDEPADLARAWDLARRFDQHPVYDMVYVAVAERLGEELLTADARLLEKVRHLGFVRGVEAG